MSDNNNNVFDSIERMNEVISTLSIGLIRIHLQNNKKGYNKYAKECLSDQERSEFIHSIEAKFGDDDLSKFVKVEVKEKAYFVKCIADKCYKYICFLPYSDFSYISKELEADLDIIFNSSWDLIYVIDSNGMTLRISSACEDILGYKAEHFVGKSVYELEKDKVFYPSVSKFVFKDKKEISKIQMTKTGRRLFTTSIPVFDEDGKLVRAVNTARDITKQTQMQREIERYKTVIKKYEQELVDFKKENRPFQLKSKAIENVYRLALKFSTIDSTVLITGETGVGKSYLAKFIHKNSPRATKPFVTIHCGSIPENLLESELFGYKQGAFTGASPKGKKGLVEAAHGGVLFLDEIGEAPLMVQVKLLQLIQEKTYMPIGAMHKEYADIRIISATNQSLEAMVKQNTFREDLYYRLSVLPIFIPPLRNRKSDILPLCYQFINKFAHVYNKTIRLSHETTNVLMNHEWKGNIRELENLIERLVIVTEDEIVHVEDLPPEVRFNQKNKLAISGGKFTLKQAMEKAEEDFLKSHAGNFKNTVEMAKALGVSQATISRKLHKYNISLRE